MFLMVGKSVSCIVPSLWQWGGEGRLECVRLLGRGGSSPDPSLLCASRVSRPDARLLACQPAWIISLPTRQAV